MPGPRRESTDRAKPFALRFNAGFPSLFAAKVYAELLITQRSQVQVLPLLLTESRRPLDEGPSSCSEGFFGSATAQLH